MKVFFAGKKIMYSFKYGRIFNVFQHFSHCAWDFPSSLLYCTIVCSFMTCIMFIHQVWREKNILKPAAGKRRCNCRNEVHHRQIGPGMFQQMTEQVCAPNRFASNIMSTILNVYSLLIFLVGWWWYVYSLYAPLVMPQWHFSFIMLGDVSGVSIPVNGIAMLSCGY